MVKSGPGLWDLTGGNTYSGSTLVNQGTLWVDGSIEPSSPGPASTVTVAPGASLGGTGYIGEAVTVNGTLMPGPDFTQLVLGAAPVLNGVTVMAINDTNSPNCVMLDVYDTLNYGGQLVLTNLGGPLATGDSFTLFSANGYNGAFTSITPAIPGPGLTWDTNSLAVDGSLKVTGTGVALNPTNITTMVNGSALSLSWPADHIGWRLEVQTNSLSVGIGTNWSTWPGSTATNAVSVPIVPANPTVFFRLAYP